MGFKKYLFTQVDNSALVVFRMIFGFLITAEAWGALTTGWVRKTLVAPEFTFNFIGFNFLQTFPGPGPQMYVWFAVMGIFGVCVMLGYRYRIAIVGYAIMWTTVYFMQKSSYNNHYYLLMLLCWVFAFLPAHKAVSIDARLHSHKASDSMPRWVYVIIIAQLFIVYTYGSIAKMYPDWLDGTAPRLLMSAKKDYWLVGGILQQEWTHYVIAYFGILFDGLIIPALLWKRTRKLALIASVFFHLFNSFVFQVGIFPYMSLGFLVFFYPPKTIYKLFLKARKTFFEPQEATSFTLPKSAHLGMIAAGVYLLIQVLLPLRQHLITDNVLWTEEGHRMSWRMMLRSKGGSIYFMGKDKATGASFRINHRELLTNKQQRTVVAKPDVIWQFAQRIKGAYAAKGQDIAVYAHGTISINGRKRKKLIDSKVDLTSVPFNYFWHNDWILDSGDYLTKE